MHDAQTLLGQHGVDDSNMYDDALATIIKERNEKDTKEQGVYTVNDISNYFILWHLPFNIREELFDIRGQELDKIFGESRDNTNGLITSWAYILFQVPIRKLAVMESSVIQISLVLGIQVPSQRKRKNQLTFSWLKGVLKYDLMNEQ
jgi:hypothetical protein